MHFTIHRSSGQCDVSLDGQFIFSDNAQFKEILQLPEAEDIQSITLHFESVTFVDSAALGMLLLLRDRANNHGVTLTLHGPGGQVKKVFDLSRFNQLFTIIE